MCGRSMFTYPYGLRSCATSVETHNSSFNKFSGMAFTFSSVLYLTPFLVVITIPISYFLFVKYKNVSNYILEINQPLYEFFKNKWYFDEIYNFIFVKPIMKIGYFLWKKIDNDIIDKFGPDGISNLIKKISNKAVKFQSGYIYQYAFIMLMGFCLILTFLIIN